MNEKYLNGSTPWRIDPTTHRTMSERSTFELRPAPLILEIRRHTGGGGGQEDGITMIFSPSHLLCTIKGQMGAGGGGGRAGAWCEWGGGGGHGPL